MSFENYDLFGNKVEYIKPTKPRAQKILFNDYEGFVDKFKAPKTTDDCYTPKDVYACVVEYVGLWLDLSDRRIVRPFYPGGDYKRCEYKDGDIVIDNPPFSIVSEITRYYIDNKVDFFLFAPHLTLFASNLDCTKLVVGADIEYNNGAKVATSFLSNVLGDYSIIGDNRLYDRILEVQNNSKPKRLKYEYPNNLLTVSRLFKIVKNGGIFHIKKPDLSYISQLDSQKSSKKAIFGSGFLASDRVVNKINNLESMPTMPSRSVKETVVWELSPYEKEVIKNLNENEK